jgi:hypothetical protein
MGSSGIYSFSMSRKKEQCSLVVAEKAVQPQKNLPQFLDAALVIFRFFARMPHEQRGAARAAWVEAFRFFSLKRGEGTTITALSA